MVGRITPPLVEAMMEVGLEEVEEYSTQRQNTVMQYSGMQKIM